MQNKWESPQWVTIDKQEKERQSGCYMVYILNSPLYQQKKFTYASHALFIFFIKVKTDLLEVQSYIH